MPLSLTDQVISTTYKGIIHSQGDAIPITDQVRLYDGTGNETSLSIGREDAGVTVFGDLSATDTIYSPNAVITEGIISPNTAKVWVNFTGSSIQGDQTINSSHNVINVMRSGTSLSTVYTVNFTSLTFKDAKYSYHITFANTKTGTNYPAFAFVDSEKPPTTSYIHLCFRKFNGTAVVPFDPEFASLTIFGN